MRIRSVKNINQSAYITDSSLSNQTFKEKPFDQHPLSYVHLDASLLFACWVILHVLSSIDVFKISLFNQRTRNTISMPNSLDSDQARQIVEPDLGPKCFQGQSSIWQMLILLFVAVFHGYMYSATTIL